MIDLKWQVSNNIGVLMGGFSVKSIHVQQIKEPSALSKVGWLVDL